MPGADVVGMQGADPTTQDAARVQLGEAITRRAPEVARTVLAGRISGSPDQYTREHPEDILRTSRLTTEQVGRWLTTGQTTTREENAQLDATAETAASGARPLATITKNYLLWRETVLGVAAEEAERLGTPAAIVGELVTTIRRASDASLVRMARRFDAARSELEEQLRIERERIDFLALHDGLTGLANRILLMDRLSSALAQVARGGTVAVLFIDVDDFKPVNDRLGHAAGDRLLVALAERLRSSVRPGDTVARLGGDEFVVVCPGLPASDGRGDAVADRLRSAVADPFDIGEPVRITLSIGIVHGTPDSTPEQLLVGADHDMYARKHRTPRRRTPAGRSGSPAGAALVTQLDARDLPAPRPTTRRQRAPR